MKQVEASGEPLLQRARASQMSPGEPIRGPRPHPPLDSHIGPLYLLCTAINAMPSWRPVFQFLIFPLYTTVTLLMRSELTLHSLVHFKVHLRLLGKEKIYFIFRFSVFSASRFSFALKLETRFQRF